MRAELLRYIDSIHREKDISLDILFEALEEALASALRKKLGGQEAISVTVDRETGEVVNDETEETIDPSLLGRIAAQTAKQVLTQKVREAERDVIYQDYEERLRHIVTGTVQRIEDGTVIVNLGKTEGIIPRREQIREETYRVGDRIRCYICHVKKSGGSVKIILSRSHPDLIRRLFDLEVPEIAERIIEIKTLAREPGYRTKIAVYSVDSKVDAVGACVGVRGTRIKNIVAELGGEKIDIVRWSDQPDIFIANALNPAEIEAISLNPSAGLARVIVAEDQLSRAIGSLGQNVRLAAKLTGWDIDVMSQQELDAELANMQDALAEVEGIGEKTISKLFGAGFSMKKLASTSLNAVLTVDGIGEATAERLTEQAREYVAEQRQKAREEKEEEEPETAEAAQAAAVDETDRRLAAALSQAAQDMPRQFDTGEHAEEEEEPPEEPEAETADEPEEPAEEEPAEEPEPAEPEAAAETEEAADESADEEEQPADSDETEFAEPITEPSEPEDEAEPAEEKIEDSN
ncbi:MAG: transcription termination factor NusA [Planctomycetota bacterium]